MLCVGLNMKVSKTAGVTHSVLLNSWRNQFIDSVGACADGGPDGVIRLRMVNTDMLEIV